jgi:hypothetical protein
MARQPLVLKLLVLPYILIIPIGKSLRYLFSNIFQITIGAFLKLLHTLTLRSNKLELALTGVFRLILLSVGIYFGLAYPWYLLSTSIYHSDHPSLFFLLQIFSLLPLGLITKLAWNSMPQSSKESARIVISNTINDGISGIVTLILILSVIGIKNLAAIRFIADQFHKNVIGALLTTLLEMMSLVILIPLTVVAPWRAYIAMKRYASYASSSLFSLSFEGIKEGLIDYFHIVMALIVTITMFNLWAMLKKLYESHTRDYREIIREYFFDLPVGILAIIFSVVNIAAIVRIPAILNEGLFTKKIGTLTTSMLYSAFLTVLIPFAIIGLAVSILTFHLIPRRYWKLSIIWSNEHAADFIFESVGILLMRLEELLYAMIFLIILILMPWRGIPLLLKLIRSGITRIDILESFCAGLLDIPSIIICAIVLVTIYRVPLYFRIRRANREKQHLLHVVSLKMLIELLLDLTVLPMICVKLMVPWRLFFSFKKAIAVKDPKLQRSFMNSGGLRNLEDLFTIVLLCMLILSVWRAPEAIYMLYNHISKILRDEEVTSSLFRKVFRSFIQLIIDVSMLILILAILVMVIEIPSFYKRMKVFVIYYHDRRGFRMLKWLQQLKKKEDHKKPVNTKNLHGISNNAFSEICKFLDIQSLSKLSQVNTKTRAKVENPVIWKNQYETSWKQYIKSNTFREITWEDDYKKLAIEGFREWRSAHSDEILDENERDYRMGARAIVLEEFVLSILHLPHMIVLPAKALAYVLGRFDYNRYFNNPRVFNRHFLIQGVNGFTIDNFARIIHDVTYI